MKPVLVIMAAGMGSRFGGLKQITPVDDAGHILMDYSIFDAMRAGFGRVVLIIKPELEADFTNLILSRLSGEVQVDFAYQTPDRLPEGFSVPEGRVKPWGTAHAVLCAREKIDAPFCVINADDFYGRTSFESIAQFLTTEASPSAHAMVGYRIENTLTENGHVARGICQTDEHSMLVSVTERTSEIGLKKALGARKGIILGQFLTESAVLTSLGGIFGVIIGIILAQVISKVSDMPVAISIPAAVGAVVFSMLIGIIFGMLPSYKAANLNPIDALRHE